MRILYAALDQTVPAHHGGSVHVTAVADGLSALGHEVRVLARPAPGRPFPDGESTWEALGPPLGLRQLRLLRAGAVLARARAFRPDAIIERYYNFGGEALLAARRTGAVAVLEVNSPVVDHQGSAKQWLDRIAIVRPMRRWREWQCRAADVIVTPSRKILPDLVPASRVLQSEWGADTDRFRPGVPGPAGFPRRAGETVAIFVGAFRAWHGAIHLVEAVRLLRSRGRSDIAAVLVGDGPEHSRVRKAAAGVDGISLVGPVDHAQMPGYLAAADVGVAPFDVAAHPGLAREFHWSPLKIFEYMASGLPVVTPAIERLRHIVRHEQEGLLYDAGAPAALASALERLADPALRQALGAAARARAVEHFSWRSHCRALDAAIRAARDAHPDRD